MRTTHLLTVASLLALALLPTPPAAAAHGLPACVLHTDVNQWACELACHEGDTITVQADTTDRDHSFPRVHATCGGVDFYCQGPGTLCTESLGPVQYDDVGTCYAETIHTRGFCLSTPTASASAPQCADGVDNDGDGAADYPADPECATPADGGEGSTSACDGPVDGVVACITPGEERGRVTIHHLETYDGPAHAVAGYVDAYRFDLPGGVSVSLPCVTLVVDGAESPSCAEAGGVFVDRLATLVDAEETEPRFLEGDVAATVGHCDATLTATVLGIGVNSAPVLTLC